jgi:putative addiction module killer protein
MIELRKTDEYNDWLRGLRDIQGRARINARISRLLDGNPGQNRVLTDGVVELKIDVGPGYRVYYVQQGSVVIVLLCGGDKDSQQEDIAKAIRMARSL